MLTVLIILALAWCIYSIIMLKLSTLAYAQAFKVLGILMVALSEVLPGETQDRLDDAMTRIATEKGIDLATIFGKDN